eukprot:TRINITY_DN111510_c0_g1_i1.p1 TRINITY_DN111510_c0_g1~~TRINITY_DN111510_c0_g1_i1.p1  ORF type:complete len:214 (+),score=45.81 TRINITY_DN111510_c0_g1_i1:86-727(+)
MGQQASTSLPEQIAAIGKNQCCAGKEMPELDESARRGYARSSASSSSQPKRSVAIEDEIETLRQSLESIHEVVGDLQAEVARLRDTNGALREANTDLSVENRGLWQSMQEQDAGSVMWRNFDIVEEHYRQLERHRVSVQLESPEALDGDASTDTQEHAPEIERFSPSHECADLSRNSHKIKEMSVESTDSPTEISIASKAVNRIRPDEAKAVN